MGYEEPYQGTRKKQSVSMTPVGSWDLFMWLVPPLGCIRLSWLSDTGLKAIFLISYHSASGLYPPPPPKHTPPCPRSLQPMIWLPKEVTNWPALGSTVVFMFPIKNRLAFGQFSLSLNTCRALLKLKKKQKTMFQTMGSVHAPRWGWASPDLPGEDPGLTNV